VSEEKRTRIERRRIVQNPGQRLRRDPRAERLPPAPAAAEVNPGSGRIRRDPRAQRGPARPAAPVEQAAPAPAIRTIAIDNPACLILAVPDLEDGRLSSHDRDLLGAARLLADGSKGAVVVLASAASKEDFTLAGADRLLNVDTGSGYAPEAKATAVLAIIAALQPRHILFCEAPAGGGDVGRRVAAALNETPAVHVMRLSASEAASRGNGGRSDYLRQPPRLLFVAPETADPPADVRHEARPLSAPPLPPAKPRIEDRGIAATDPNAVPLTEADFIVSAGNGVTDWPGFHEVAAALGAAEGGSRVVCDAGLLPRERQVGASGSLVEPRCYLAFGIAGAPQHLQGIVRCERVLAVNTDLHAEMVKRADLAIIADAQAVMPALASLARERPRGSGS
jgi:N,N-dimethylglycine/sarcosine catabolism electron transfer flavoprotein subunit alpha